ncbi:MAG: sugar phosphate isomerase/epimerase [Bacteroidales bacterium]|nr:sugar phosphate isomerase/epimerase [Bacteroidales bacterium]
MMMKNNKQKVNLVKRIFLRATAITTFITAICILNYGCKGSAKPEPVNSNFGGVQVGTTTYSFRSMPSSAEAMLQYCLDAGISSVELLGNVIESYAGLPPGPPRPAWGVELTREQQLAYDSSMAVASEIQREWRINAPMTKFEELRKMYNDSGVNIHIANLSPANWSDEEIDYAFNAAKALGAMGVCNEIGEEACKRLAPFAEKYGMFAIFHNHGQPADPGWSFDPFLEISPAIMLNFDAGHYFGFTGQDPAEIIQRHHDRIVSIHLKDKTGPDSDPPNKNMPWGQGDTPIAEILQLVQSEGWDIHCDIELEYDIPEDSDAVAEVKKCVEYSKNILKPR